MKHRTFVGRHCIACLAIRIAALATLAAFAYGVGRLYLAWHP